MSAIAELERPGGKSKLAFRTISEVAEELQVPQHVLRFWESKFAQIKPVKRGGGRRYYRPADVELLRRIRELLYTDGYTIKGVQKLLRETGGRQPAPPRASSEDAAAEVPGPAPETAPVAEGAPANELPSLLAELIELRDILWRAGR